MGRKTDEIPELDEMSGVVRDVSIPSSDDVIPIGRVGLGEGLRRFQRCECYNGDTEPLTQVDFWELYNRITGVKLTNTGNSLINIVNKQAIM